MRHWRLASQAEFPRSSLSFSAAKFINIVGPAVVNSLDASSPSNLEARAASLAMILVLHAVNSPSMSTPRRCQLLVDVYATPLFVSREFQD